jgi:hypothetical protein
MRPSFIAEPDLFAASFSNALAAAMASRIAVTHLCIVAKSSASTTSAVFDFSFGIV